MLYPVYVHPGDDGHAHGVTFPDFPGCFAAADDWAGLPAAIQEAVQAHFHGEGAQAVPLPRALDVLAADPQYAGGLWLLADVDLSRIDTTPVLLNQQQETSMDDTTAGADREALGLRRLELYAHAADWATIKALAAEVQSAREGVTPPAPSADPRVDDAVRAALVGVLGMLQALLEQGREVEADLDIDTGATEALEWAISDVAGRLATVPGPTAPA